MGFKGTALIGCAVKSPLAVLEKIYCLPMMTILMNKGTGVVTSVPSDSRVNPSSSLLAWLIALGSCSPLRGSALPPGPWPSRMLL